MKRLIAVCAVGALLGVSLLCGCVSLKVGTQADTSQVKVAGLASGFAQLSQIPPYKGGILEANVLGGRQTGEALSLDIWPIGGVGLGLLGARINLPFIEMGLGTLFYQPHPLNDALGAPAKETKHEKEERKEGEREGDK